MYLRLGLLTLIGIAALGAIAACAPVKLLNATIPTDGYTVHKDVPYGDNTRQKFDVYVPQSAAPENKLPVIVFFYGGSWQWGSKNDYLFLGQALASKGFVTVIVDYRLYPEVYCPAFVSDGAAAVRFVHDHIGDYNGDGNKLFLAGHSAGAYIAMMMTVNKIFFADAGVDERWVKGAIGISGPYDFLPFTDPNIIALFSKTKDADTQPINFVTNHNPPIFLASGDDDDTVLLRNTNHLETKLRALGNKVETKVYPGIGHIGIMLSLARGFRSKTTLLDDITDFVNRYDGTPVAMPAPAVPAAPEPQPSVLMPPVAQPVNATAAPAPVKPKLLPLDVVAIPPESTGR